MPSLPHPLFPFFPKADQRRHRAALVEATQRVLDSGRYVLGEECQAFEAEMGAFLDGRHVVGVASGTDAIELMLRALDIGHGSRVVVPAHAPSAVAAGVSRTGAELIFADIEAAGHTLCPDSLDLMLRAQAGRNVRAVVAVHLYGHPADWGRLRQVAENHGAALLEDAAQAHGATFHGRKAGTLGTLAATSFYPTKNLGACGDAGAVITSDAALANRLRLLRQYGWSEPHVSGSRGVNSRLDEMQAAILRAKLPFLQESVAQRRRLAAIYDARLGGSGLLRTPQVRGGCEHACHQYVVRSRRRDELLHHLQGLGIPAAVHYPVPLHRQPAYQAAVELPEAELAAREVLSLPLHPHLTEDAVNLVCETLESLDHAGA